MKDAEAWQIFAGIMDKARRGPADGLIPVALIMAPSRQARADGMDVGVSNVRVLWVAGFPIEDRGHLFASVAEMYQEMSITRIEVE